MTQNTFFIADTHFSHKNSCVFTKEDGSKLRPWDNVEEMDEELIKRWNEVVRPQDKIYHLGDVAIPRKGLDVMARLNGDKILIRGNHDIFKIKDYLKYFRDIRGAHVMDNIIFTHVPVHPDSKGRFRANVHGHLHARRVMVENRAQGLQKRQYFIDPFYLCVSVENIDFRPIAYEEVLKQIL